MKWKLTLILSPLLFVAALFQSYEWLCLFAFIPLIDLLENECGTLVQAFIFGFWTQFIYFIFAFHWIFHSFQSYFQFSKETAGILTFFICMLGALQWGLCSSLYYKFRNWSPHNSTIYRIFLFVSCFSIFNFFVYQIFPLHFGFHFYKGNLPGQFLARFIGWQGLGFLVLVINSVIYFTFKKSFKRGLLGFFGILGVLFFFDLICKPAPVNTSAQKSQQEIRILAIQGAISNEDKRSDLQKAMIKMEIMDQYYSLTRRGIKESQARIDLIVWPETAIPSIFEEGKIDEALQKDLMGFINDVQIPLLSGGYLQKKGLRNVALLFAPQSTNFQFSPKQKLFPLGEYIPFSDFGGLTKGLFPDVPRFQNDMISGPLQVLPGIKVTVPICYEILFDQYLLPSIKDTQFIVSISNDSWFESEMQKDWHATISFSRSLELGLPVLRVTNDGISGVATEDGNVFQVSKNTPEVFHQVLKLQKQSQTFYQLQGDWIRFIPELFSILFLIVLFSVNSLLNVKKIL